jgi:hypothetical protein
MGTKRQRLLEQRRAKAKNTAARILEESGMTFPSKRMRDEFLRNLVELTQLQTPRRTAADTFLDRITERG